MLKQLSSADMLCIKWNMFTFRVSSFFILFFCAAKPHKSEVLAKLFEVNPVLTCFFFFFFTFYLSVSIPAGTLMRRNDTHRRKNDVISKSYACWNEIKIETTVLHRYLVAII